MQTYILSHLAQILHTGIYCVRGGKLDVYEENAEYNPIYKSEKLRAKLRHGADAQKEPYIFMDEYQAFFVCVKRDADQGEALKVSGGQTEAGSAVGSGWETGDGVTRGGEYFLMGPLCTKSMGRVERHHFYRTYGVDEAWEKGLYYHTLMEALKAAGMLAKLVVGQEYTDQDLVDANHLSQVTKEQEEKERIRFNIESDEEDVYRHTYQEERKLLDMVRDGNVGEAVRLSKEMDTQIGKLGSDELTHWRNLLTVAASLCARAAIEGGVMPYVAYRVSGFYINKGSQCDDVVQILTYRNHAVEELTKLVQGQKTKHHTSYTERCKDYVRKNYREKIYLEEIADTLGISGSYLSRLFKKETGVCLQDFVNEVRVEKAANLLIYSDEPLPRIAEYVNFPSQSYFGKIFKEKKQMTPRQYREMYKPTEFAE